MTYAEQLLADRRLCVLRLLLDQDGCANDRVLELGLLGLGHRANLDRAYVREIVRFLETADCVTVELFQDKVMVAHLTERGALVAQGRIRCEGVARPSFGG